MRLLLSACDRCFFLLNLADTAELVQPLTRMTGVCSVCCCGWWDCPVVAMVFSTKYCDIRPFLRHLLHHITCWPTFSCLNCTGESYFFRSEINFAKCVFDPLQTVSVRHRLHASLWHSAIIGDTSRCSCLVQLLTGCDDCFFLIHQLWVVVCVLKLSTMSQQWSTVLMEEEKLKVESMRR